MRPLAACCATRDDAKTVTGDKKALKPRAPVRIPILFGGRADATSPPRRGRSVTAGPPEALRDYANQSVLADRVRYGVVPETNRSGGARGFKSQRQLRLRRCRHRRPGRS